MLIKIIGVMFAVIAALATIGTATSLTSLVNAQEQNFTAILSSHREVPVFYSAAKGMAEFTVNGDNVQYSVNPSDIEAVTAGHIHSGKQGENGPILVTLFKNDSPTNEVSENGTITTNNLEGPMAGKQLAELATAMSNGETYVNVHTEQNPDGEIRGQIMNSRGSQ